MAIKLARRLIGVDEYHKMIEIGILTEKDRVELINGEILIMSPIGSEHTACVKRINMVFNKTFGDKAIIGIQDPVTIRPNSEPEPDISVLKLKKDFYADKHPSPNDVIFLVEVADSTLSFDKEIKLEIYAEGGIPEYWVVNLKKKMIEVHLNPVGKKYKNIDMFSAGETIKVRSLNVEFNVDDLLG